MKNISKLIEGLVFLSGDQGITIGELITVINIDQMTIENEIATLNKTLKSHDRAITIIKTAQTYKFVTNEHEYEYYQKYADLDDNTTLSPSALETLSIIAYNQPTTRFEIEQKRGVMVGYLLKTLQSKELIKISGKSDEIGKPNLYSTTGEFLDLLSINSLQELPPLSSFTLDETTDNFDLFDEGGDFKEIKKRLLESNNIIKKIDDIDIDNAKEIIIPELILSNEELENE